MSLNNTRSEQMFLLPGSIYFEQYGDQVYIRNTANQQDYLFTETAYEILRCFSKSEPRSADMILQHLQAVYEIDNEPEFQADILDFLEGLAGSGILEPMQAAEAPEPEILDLVQEYCAEHRILQQLTLELTYRCNEKCVHCYVDGPAPNDRELTQAEYRDLLQQAREAGCLSLLLTGGEVCMRPDWIEIAEYAASLGMLVDIYSNGIALTDALFDRICALHPNSLSFSLYGGTPAVHDAITQVPGSFERTLKSVMMTKCAGIDTYIKTVVMKENAADLENLFHLGQRIHVAVTPALTIYDSYAGISRSGHMLDTVEEYRRVISLCRRYAPNVISRGYRDLNGSACKAGQSCLTVDPYGNVAACMSVQPVLGNVREKSILEIWQHSGALEKIRGIRCVDLCARSPDCDCSDFCHFCMARMDPASGSLPADTCMLAQAARLVSSK